MKFSAGLLTIFVALTTLAEATPTHHHHHARSLAHSHRRHHKRVEEVHLVQRSKGKKAKHTVTKFKTATSTVWVDPPKPTKTSKKEEDKPKETKKEDKPKESKPADSGANGVNDEFPDGVYGCDKVPSGFGTMSLDWVLPGSGGWSGIQKDGGNPDRCTDGALCSYSCEPGYSKAQWPDVQPASGESHGGLLCKNGKLYKTSSKYKTLCVKGTGNVYVRNKLSKGVAVCRTDYPGTENMVVPTFTNPGETKDLTVVDSGSYYVWQGKMTSSQYYVNNAGVPLEEGCIWGVPNADKGNWSPMIFGAGYSNGMAYISISQNQLNSNPLNYNVRIVPGPNSELNGECKYENQKFIGKSCTSEGCTCALKSGTAYFELY